MSQTLVPVRTQDSNEGTATQKHTLHSASEMKSMLKRASVAIGQTTEKALGTVTGTLGKLRDAPHQDPSEHRASDTCNCR
jgi:hypothetical protein